ncbi:MAG: radical SAM protein [Kiritimatiellae bacterium]|nr:radical SAM protein [Kiritimatiellia bacterium]
MKCNPYKSGYEFDKADIEDAVRRSGLLSLEIEFSQKCNFRCPYCYVSTSGKGDELTRSEIKNVILQAKDLGARKIIVLGGEPMIYPHIMEMIDFIRNENMDVELFTNGTNMTPDAASHLAGLNVKVVLKMNTLDAGLQNVLSGFDSAHDVIQSAFSALTGAGYSGDGKSMGVSTIICKNNLEELPELWQWLRDRKIEPYFEMITPQGSAENNQWLVPGIDEVAEVFNVINKIDRERYGFEWECQPPLVGNKCLRHLFSCLVNAYGDVLPCVGVTIAVGNIRKEKLGHILRDSEVIHGLRHYRETIKGPCADCDKLAECYGCRGAAYQMTGDYLASDPLCWLIGDRKSEIKSLPMAVVDIIPQKSPMRLVDTLVSVGEKEAVVETTISGDSPFVGEDGTLDDAAYLEIIAQSAAAMNGFKRSRNGKNGGLLLGAKNMEILGVSRVGDSLRINIQKCAKYDNFGIVAGAVSRGEEIIAKGEIKIWSPETVE